MSENKDWNWEDHWTPLEGADGNITYVNDEDNTLMKEDTDDPPGPPTQNWTPPTSDTPPSSNSSSSDPDWNWEKYWTPLEGADGNITYVNDEDNTLMKEEDDYPPGPPTQNWTPPTSDTPPSSNSSPSDPDWNWEDHWTPLEGADGNITYVNDEDNTLMKEDTDDPPGPPTQNWTPPTSDTPSSDPGWKWEDHWTPALDETGERILYTNNKTGDTKYDDEEPQGPPTIGYVSRNFLPKKINEWIETANKKWSSNGRIQDSQPTVWHKFRKDGKIVFYRDDEDTRAEVSSLPNEILDVISDDKNDIVDDVRQLYAELQRGENSKFLEFPLPDLEEIDLKTFNIHYIKGIYSEKYVALFNEKIKKLKEKIKGLRDGRPGVMQNKMAVKHYGELIDKILKREYIYFPRIPCKLAGCFSITKKDGATDDDYEITAFTNPKLNGGSGKFYDNFSSDEYQGIYEVTDPEYQFSYEIGFDSCIGECGIIQLHYLVIRNVMTEEVSTAGAITNNTKAEFKADLTLNNSIMIINSGKGDMGEVIKPTAEALLHLANFEKEIPNFKATKLHDIVDSRPGFGIIFDNNLRRNVLEMLYFFSDQNNGNIDDIKEIKPNMQIVAEKLVSKVDSSTKGFFNQYPGDGFTKNSEKDFLHLGGGVKRNKPKKLRMFLDRMRRIYKRHIRRNNKRSKKKQPKKNKTRRKKKNGIKKSRKN